MKTNILIVEDDKIVSFEIQSILNQNGFDSDICESYKCFIENLDIFKPELVLIDIDLNKKYEGIQIGSYLNSKSKIPFIYITGYTDLETFKRIQTTKPVAYLSKPFREVDIISNIELALYNKKSSFDDVGNQKAEEVSKYSKPIRRALEYIHTNINQEIKTDELIRVSGWSRFHFIREFGKEVSKTPYQYVLDEKMKLASSKLKNTYQTVKEIAFDIGYTSNSSFTNAFVKHSGISPSSFRKKYCR